MKSVCILLLMPTLPLAAQWLNYPEARTPRTKDGKPNLTAPAPRMNGNPDFSGVWQAERTPESEYARVLGKDVVKVQVDLNDVTREAVNVFGELGRGSSPFALRPWQSQSSTWESIVPRPAVCRLAFQPAYLSLHLR